ncbi:MAG: N-succinylarginine dihydrolase, partial [Planctomycetota bacterium]
RACIDAQLFMLASLHFASQPLCRIEVSQAELPMEEAVASYFFNSQLLSPSQLEGSEGLDDFRYEDSGMVLVCPGQCLEIDSARQLIERLIADPGNPISAVHYVTLAESMANGGGPACLRLRVSLCEEELAQVDSRFRVTPESLDKLRSVIEREYPDRLVGSDFLNADCRQQIRKATECLRSALLG